MYKIISEKGNVKIFENEENKIFLIGLSELLPMYKLSYKNNDNREEIIKKSFKKLNEAVLIQESIIFKLDAPEITQVTNKYFKLLKKFNSSEAYEQLSELEKFIYLMQDFDNESLLNGLRFWATVNDYASYREIITLIYSISILFGQHTTDKTILKIKTLLNELSFYKETGILSNSFKKLTINYYKIRKDFLMKWYKEIKKRYCCYA